MLLIRIQNECHKCDGVGIHYKDTPQGVVAFDPCPTCSGEKLLTVSYISLPSSVFFGYQVYEAIDHDEYVALPEPNEEHVGAITGLGAVDLSDGSRARTVLWSLFDSESTTRANLIALIG